ncbi:MAG TPA: hypothetical protein VIX20_03850 [Ktedonobacteraceae bacterium]
MLGDFVLEVIGTPMMQEVSMMDRAASTGFEGIAQMLLEQKKLMDALEAENRELRRQIADLRHGVGIAVVIDGKTIQLANDASNNVQSQSTLQSLQNLQNTPPMSSTYTQSGRQTGSQQSVNLGSDKRENGTTRSPLADSFVL